MMARKFLDDKRDTEAANVDMENDSNIEDTHKLTGIQLVTGAIQKKTVEPKNDLKTMKHPKAVLAKDDKDDKVNPNDPQNLNARSDMEDDEGDSEQKALDIIWANWTPEKHQARHQSKPKKTSNHPSQLQTKLDIPPSSLTTPRSKSQRPLSDNNLNPKLLK